jgi:hypothetical protein
LREEYRLRVFENMTLRRISGPKRVEVIGECGKLNNEELNDLYSPAVVRVIKSRRMIWAWHAARMREKRGVYRGLVGNLRERDHLIDPGVDARIILRQIFRKWDVGVLNGLNWIRIETGGGHL